MGAFIYHLGNADESRNHFLQAQLKHWGSAACRIPLHLMLLLVFFKSLIGMNTAQTIQFNFFFCSCLKLERQGRAYSTRGRAISIKTRFDVVWLSQCCRQISPAEGAVD